MAVDSKCFYILVLEILGKISCVTDTTKKEPFDYLFLILLLGSILILTLLEIYDTGH